MLLMWKGLYDGSVMAPQLDHLNNRSSVWVAYGAGLCYSHIIIGIIKKLKCKCVFSIEVLLFSIFTGPSCTGSVSLPARSQIKSK